MKFDASTLHSIYELVLAIEVDVIEGWNRRGTDLVRGALVLRRAASVSSSEMDGTRSMVTSLGGWALVLARQSDEHETRIVITIELDGEVACLIASGPASTNDEDLPALVGLLRTARPSWGPTATLGELLTLPAVGTSPRDR